MPTNIFYEVLKYWCWVCHEPRNHNMITEEKGKCVVCNSVNYAPMGDID